MSKTQKPEESIVILDRPDRRRFIRTGGGALLAGVTATSSGSLLAADCDQQQNSASDQDAGEQADPKGCQSRNIISRSQPLRESPVVVKKIKA